MEIYQYIIIVSVLIIIALAIIKMSKKVRKNVKLLGLYFRSDFTDLNEFMNYFNNLSNKEQKAILRSK